MNNQQHMGEKLREVLKNLNYPLTKLSSELGKSRTWIYDQFDNVKIDKYIILEISEAVRYDMRKHFPELFEYKIEDENFNSINEAIYNYKQQREKNILLEDQLKLQKKYISMLEDKLDRNGIKIEKE